MPEKLERCVKQLLAKGYPKDSAWAICTKSLQGKRKKKKGHKPEEKGEKE